MFFVQGHVTERSQGLFNDDLKISLQSSDERHIVCKFNFLSNFIFGIKNIKKFVLFFFHCVHERENKILDKE